jgi:hypothetical protein
MNQMLRKAELESCWPDVLGLVRQTNSILFISALYSTKQQYSGCSFLDTRKCQEHQSMPMLACEAATMSIRRSLRFSHKEVLIGNNCSTSEKKREKLEDHACWLSMPSCMRSRWLTPTKWSIREQLSCMWMLRRKDPSPTESKNGAIGSCSSSESCSIPKKWQRLASKSSKWPMFSKNTCRTFGSRD